MKHFIENNSYKIVDDNNIIILSIDLDVTLPNNQIVIKTNNEVYAGPVNFIKFKED